MLICKILRTKINNDYVQGIYSQNIDKRILREFIREIFLPICFYFIYIFERKTVKMSFYSTACSITAMSHAQIVAGLS